MPNPKITSVAELKRYLRPGKYIEMTWNIDPNCRLIGKRRKVVNSTSTHLGLSTVNVIGELFTSWLNWKLASSVELRPTGFDVIEDGKVLIQYKYCED